MLALIDENVLILLIVKAKVLRSNWSFEWWTTSLIDVKIKNCFETFQLDLFNWEQIFFKHSLSHCTRHRKLQPLFSIFSRRTSRLAWIEELVYLYFWPCQSVLSKSIDLLFEVWKLLWRDKRIVICIGDQRLVSCCNAGKFRKDTDFLLSLTCISYHRGSRWLDIIINNFSLLDHSSFWLKSWEILSFVKVYVLLIPNYL